MSWMSESTDWMRGLFHREIPAIQHRGLGVLRQEKKYTMDEVFHLHNIH